MQIQNWLLGGGLTLILGMMGLLIRISYRIGGDARDITKGLDSIKEMEQQLKQIPIIIKDIEQLENQYSTLRSDFKDLRKRAYRSPSRPDFGEGEDG